MSPFTTVHELADGLASGAYSSVELTKDFLERIEQDQSNAFVTVTAETALKSAAEQDQARQSGDASWLAGVPMAHKDIFCTQGIRTTAGSHMLENFIAPYNATVVNRINNQGMVMLGKTNMDEFAMGSSNENSYFGPVTSPWGEALVPGGSSGGSAAAVAAGLTPVATGTDTGGSIRQPASLCGITGLKPTYGRVSRYGMIAFASSLDQAGPMTHDAQDAAIILAAMAGFDERDSTSADRQDVWMAGALQGKLIRPASLTIGLPRQYFNHANDSAASLDEVRRCLEGQGHTCVDVELPHTDAAISAYYVIAGAEASTNLSRYDGVRFGHRSDNSESLEDLYQRSRSEGFGAEVKRRILTGTYALSVGYYDAYYLKAQKIRRLIANDFAQAFTEVDVLLAPTTLGGAFAQDSLTQDPVAMYQQDKFTVPTSLAGLPALSMPCGFADGLPVGAQLIGPAFREDLILGLADAYQSETDWHHLHPEQTA
ncbi:MAG: Asp-tRNA(Asn)/Glu-tRNA(Gln) amidotransferase subunit GatA [Pseudomonadales bacterium]|nr:Asp-tRNA(Asn)/Glu-tRNA(Gln) amidotransferase subunit GatA [Pseudomonadales bacterium]